MATFGNTDTDYTTNTTMKDRIKGCFASPASDGTVTSITAYLDHLGAATKYKCALYEYVDYASSYAGDVIAETEELSVEGTYHDLKQFDFAVADRPVVTNGTNYYIMLFGENAGELSAMSVKTGGSNCAWVAQAYNDFPSPLTGEAASSLYYMIFATYTPKTDHEVNLSETLSLGESIAADMGMSLSETLSLAESIAANMGMSLSETLALAESIDILHTPGPVRRKYGGPYGLKPARTVRAGRIGV